MPDTIAIIGNWKMHGSKELIANYMQEIASHFGNQVSHRLGLALPTTLLADGIHQFNQYGWWGGAQNVSEHASGAFTGCISATMLAEQGCNFCLVGHSERRIYQQETDQQIADKVARLNEYNIVPIVCVGETSTQKQRGETEKIITRQLTSCLPALQQAQHALVAYEPVWAIGTGQSATTQQVAQVHRFIREILDTHNQKNVKILYGGSVNAENVAALVGEKNVDGVLVGGVSLQPTVFCRLIQNALQA